MSDSRLRNYALTAGGSAALAATSLAGADIQQGTGATPISLNQSEELFTINGTQFFARHSGLGGWSSSGYAYAGFTATGFASGKFAMMNAGDLISTTFTGNNGYISNYMSFKGSEMTFNSGSLSLGTGEIVGFSLTDSGGETYYGWIDYDLSISEGTYDFTVNRWAYNDVANEGIIAGENRAAGSSAVPGLGGLAALAIGAAGVRSRRQRTVA